MGSGRIVLLFRKVMAGDVLIVSRLDRLVHPTHDLLNGSTTSITLEQASEHIVGSKNTDLALLTRD